MNLSDVSQLSPQPSAHLLPQQYQMGPHTMPSVSPQMMPPPAMGSPYTNPGYQGYPMQQYPAGYQGQPWQGQQQAWQQQQPWLPTLPQQPWTPQQQQPWSPQKQPWPSPRGQQPWPSPQRQQPWPSPQEQQPWPSPQGQQPPLPQANQSYPNVYQYPFPASGENPPHYDQLFGGVPPQNGPQVDQTDVDVAAVAKAPHKFKVGMRLEAVDRRFPYFVCVATIANVREEGEEVLIHFDGWTDKYDYWCVCDAVELHPVGWCETHDWELQPPHGKDEILTCTHSYIP